ncbi:MAG: bifunctional isocitrate dehydrogenase kinase/phosphatase [Steroidobacteraceae bacterium]
MSPKHIDAAPGPGVTAPGPAVAAGTASAGTRGRWDGRRVEDAFGQAFRAGQMAQLIVGAFLRYNALFRDVTRRAPARFAARDWHGAQHDSVERIELYDRCVAEAADELRTLGGGAEGDLELWRQAKRHFAHLIDGLPDSEFIKTFFSSITRKLFSTVGVSPDIEFVATDLDPLSNVDATVVTRTYRIGPASAPNLAPVFADGWFSLPWHDIDATLASASRILANDLALLDRDDGALRFECISAVFFQTTRAYLIGRVAGRDWFEPVAFAVRHDPEGLALDAVLIGEDDVSGLFSFTRSYFQVDLDRVVESVAFIKRLLPRKPVGELFTVLGRAKQGKTERYRIIMQRLAASADLFDHAAGERGLVMICFAMASLDVVFKVIRDRIPELKATSREGVKRQYDFVFKHDRAGRLIDVQEFRRLRFPAARFAPGLLDDLLAEAGDSVRREGDDVVLEHVYVERRLVPLNLFLRDTTGIAAERALLDYGQALKDLARSDIFAGDLLLKNFGVNRHGRVIFYDYDEVCPLSECVFRDMPQSSDPDDDMRSEPWFYVGEKDIFPETFPNFLPMAPTLREAFMRVHADLFTADFWRGTQRRIAKGEVLELLPYRAQR